MKVLEIILSTLLVNFCSMEVANKSPSSSSQHGSCPLLDGVFVSVMRRIFNPGFHKELVSEVELMLTTTLLPDKCTLLMEETIPRGAYVDHDQLRELRYRTGLRSYIPTRVDIEKPEFESESFRVFLFRSLRVQENLRVTNIQLPVHMRYHKPDAPPPSKSFNNEPSAPMATVKISNPRLMLSCQDEDLLSNCSDRMVTSFCDETGEDRCEWLNLPYKINVQSIEVSIPVGNTEHTSLVVAVTTIVTCGATIYLVISMFRDIKHKTE